MKPKRECPLCQNNDVEKIYHINYIGNKNINGLPELVDIVTDVTYPVFVSIPHSIL